MRRLLLLALLVGCSSSRDKAQAAEPPAAVAPPTQPGLTLGDRLIQEAQSRPSGALRVEQVLDALGASHPTQVLAGPVMARFCMAGRTADGLGVAACEYDSDDAAERGRDHSRRTFDRMVPNRILAVHRGTLLTVTFPDAAGAETGGRLVKAFEAL